MRSTPSTPTTSTLHRRVGRKVLQADKLASVLSPQPQPRFKNLRTLPLPKPKVVTIACVVILLLSALGVGATRYYNSQAAAAEKVAATAKQKKLEVKNAAAVACRQKKAEEKADQLGKITYDELYDHNACDK